MFSRFSSRLDSRSLVGVRVPTDALLLALLIVVPGFAAPQRKAVLLKKGKPAPQAAALPLEKSVATHQAAARKLAAKSRWKAALLEIGKAQREIHAASRAVPPPPSRSAAYLKEANALRQKLARQRRLAAEGKANLPRALAEYSAARKALVRKYGLMPKPGTAATQVRPPAERARFLLLGSTLSDQSAEYYLHSGNRQQAQQVREDALRDRLLAYHALGKYEPAGTVAEKLLAMNPTRPNLFRVVGDY